jgi:hypothetical protein
MKFSKAVFIRQIDLGRPILNSYSFDTVRGATLTACEFGVIIEHASLEAPELIPWHLVEKSTILQEQPAIPAAKLKAAK